MDLRDRNINILPFSYANLFLVVVKLFFEVMFSQNKIRRGCKQSSDAGGL